MLGSPVWPVPKRWHQPLKSSFQLMPRAQLNKWKGSKAKGKCNYKEHKDAGKTANEHLILEPCCIFLSCPLILCFRVIFIRCCRHTLPSGVECRSWTDIKIVSCDFWTSSFTHQICFHCTYSHLPFYWCANFSSFLKCTSFNAIVQDFCVSVCRSKMCMKSRLCFRDSSLCHMWRK